MKFREGRKRLRRDGYAAPYFSRGQEVPVVREEFAGAHGDVKLRFERSMPLQLAAPEESR